MDNMLLKANPSLPIHPSHAYMLIAPNLNKLSGLRKGSVNKYVQAPCCSGLKNRSSGSICVTCLTSMLPVQTLMALMQDADSPIAEDVRMALLTMALRKMALRKCRSLSGPRVSSWRLRRMRTPCIFSSIEMHSFMTGDHSRSLQHRAGQHSLMLQDRIQLQARSNDCKYCLF